MPSATDSIGVFDSGLGGLTVMKQLINAMPHEHFIFYGDTARLPYGEKSPETVIRYSLENADLLLKKHIKMLVVACSTASSLAMPALQQQLDIPVVGMIEPGAESALSASHSGHIAVLGTRGTIKSQAYMQAILRRAPQTTVTSIACPLFVPLIEEHLLDHPATRLIIQEYLSPLTTQTIDTILLGCTHYPILQKIIAHETGTGIAIVDPAIACSQHVQHMLHKYQLNAPAAACRDPSYFVSDNPEKFRNLGATFLGYPISTVEHIAH